MVLRMIGVLLVGVIAHLSFGADSDQSEFIRQFKAYTTFNFLKVNFTQEKTLMELKAPLVSKGTLSVDRKAKTLKWQVVEPSPLLVNIGPEQLTIESGEGEGRNVQTFSLKQMNRDAKSWQDLSVWIDFNPIEISKKYEIKKMDAKSFELRPLNIQSSPFKSLKIVSSIEGHVQQIDMVEKSGDLLTLKFLIPKILKR